MSIEANASGIYRQACCWLVDEYLLSCLNKHTSGRCTAEMTGLCVAARFHAPLGGGPYAAVWQLKSIGLNAHRSALQAGFSSFYNAWHHACLTHMLASTMAPVNVKFESERVVCHLGCAPAREVGHGARVSCIENKYVGVLLN